MGIFCYEIFCNLAANVCIIMNSRMIFMFKRKPKLFIDLGILFFTFFLVPLLLEKINAEHEKWEIPQQLNLWWRKS
jgi:hypothetical protein